MLAERVPSLLPDLDLHEALQVSAVHSLAGFHLDQLELVTRPPFSDPHHSATMVSMVDGGPRLAQPGAISRCPLGVLFLDEATEPQHIHALLAKFRPYLDRESPTRPLIRRRATGKARSGLNQDERAELITEVRDAIGSELDNQPDRPTGPPHHSASSRITRPGFIRWISGGCEL